MPGTVVHTGNSAVVMRSPCSQGYTLVGEVLWTRVLKRWRMLCLVWGIPEGSLGAPAVYKIMISPVSPKHLEVGRR